MAQYLLKFKGKYRILPELDLSTNDVPRDANGNICQEFDDIYIACQYGNKIYNYGSGILVAYIPSIGRGHNIIKHIFTEYQNGNLDLYSNQTGQDKNGEIISSIDYERLYNDKSLNQIIFNIRETDAEIEFRFKAKDIDLIATLLKAKTSGANISPFSKKNLPKAKNVDIPTDEIERYKAITAVVKKEDLLTIHKITNRFLDSVLQKSIKKYTKDFNYKSDMKALCMSRQIKEYIYIKGMWDEYLAYLKKEIELFYINKQG